MQGLNLVRSCSEEENTDLLQTKTAAKYDTTKPLQKTDQTELRVSMGTYIKENGSVLYHWKNVEDRWNKQQKVTTYRKKC